MTHRMHTIVAGILFMFLMLIATTFCAPVAWAQETTAVPAAAHGPAAEQLPTLTPETTDPKLALGFVIDVLPIAMSAASGEFGMSGQTWFGVNHVRLRLVGAHMHMPNFLAAKDGFQDMDTTALAGLVDYTFGKHFDEWWVGTGFELWLNSIGHQDAPGDRVRWTNAVWTLGGGYIWRVAGNFTLEPWAAIHVPMNNHSVSLANKSYTPLPVSGEVSLKIGYFFDL